MLSWMDGTSCRRLAATLVVVSVCACLASAQSPASREYRSVDSMISEVLVEQEMTPAGKASRGELLRRVHLDLTGLLPSVEDCEAAESGWNFERTVDRLLSSPHFGERWGQHWLDLVVYADSDGFAYDATRPAAWRYRDWVIAAFNADMEFGDFTFLQLAGDLTGVHQEAIPTGFLRNARDNKDGGVDPEEARHRRQVERVTTIGFAWLGQKLACAECHDHPEESISQAEFTQLLAYLEPIDEAERAVDSDQQATLLQQQRERHRLVRKMADREATLKEGFAAWVHKRTPEPRSPMATQEPLRQDYGTEDWWRAGTAVFGGLFTIVGIVLRSRGMLACAMVVWTGAIGVWPTFGTDAAAASRPDDMLGEKEGPGGDREKLWKEYLGCDPQHRFCRAEMARIDARISTIPSFLAVSESDRHPIVTVRVNGNYEVLGERVRPALPEVWEDLAISPTDRKGFAEWLASRDNIAVSRHFVNWVWTRLFGEPLSNDESDPDARRLRRRVLHRLVDEFVRHGRSPKWLIRTIVLSDAYQRSSVERSSESDAAKRRSFLGRQNRWRLDGEAVRDVTLQLSGTLLPEVGGESVRPPLPPGFDDVTYETWKPQTGALLNRRSVYLFKKRSLANPFLTAFDLPAGTEAVAVRPETNSATQALAGLNSPELFDATRLWASRIVESRREPSARIETAFLQLLARRPTSAEARVVRESLERFGALFSVHAGAGQGADVAAWTGVCRVLLNTDEGLTRN